MFYPDLIIKNARIYTVDAAYSRKEAMAVLHGKIAALGTNDEICGLSSAGTRIVDAGGKTILPGFIDAHSHILSMEGKNLLQVNCSARAIRGIDDLIRVLKQRAEETPPGRWVLGVEYDDTKLAEKRHPTRWDLDRVSTNHPVHIRHVSGHIGVVNSRALEYGEVPGDIEDPTGGAFDRNGDGELNGVCRENADFYFTHMLIPPFSEEDMLKGLLLAQKEYNRMGITSAGDALVKSLEIKAFQQALNRGELTVRISMMVYEDYLQYLKELKLYTGFGNDFLRIGPIKSFVDGAISGRTAWLSEPYIGRKDDYGIAVKAPEEIEALVMDAHKAGFQLAVHANGDRAIDTLLDAYEKALNESPRRDHRHRIEHCTVVNPRILDRMKRLGVVAIPFSTFIYQHGEKMGEYGDRISMMSAHRSFLDYGIPVAGSSDHPCVTADPMVALYAMTTRKSSSGVTLGPEQRISIQEAIRIYSMGSAYASFEEKMKGSLEPGKLADFVVLDKDPHEVDPEALPDMKVERTFVGGSEVFSC